ncbi:hypothetical protein [Desulfosoma caldarium]|uniref:Uncharacterized protein n=1 Tax=Desulfosoma caldarium TaxID=610254 RepID=A0A3N1VLZ4_9BACT|nr:hypothetical protein [Desulfosoma caldarium]ROR02960.1 hypothetical protein EDC27_0214 [Desulfosoma caldarium]
MDQVFRDRTDKLFVKKVAAFVAENEQRARELALMEKVVRVKTAFSMLGNLVLRMKPLPHGSLLGAR